MCDLRLNTKKKKKTLHRVLAGHDAYLPTVIEGILQMFSKEEEYSH